MEQNEALWADALQMVRCESLFRDVMTGIKFEQKRLDEALASMISTRTCEEMGYLFFIEEMDTGNIQIISLCLIAGGLPKLSLDATAIG